MRGLWRWWEERNGADFWRARVEVRLGEWADMDAERYERTGCQPPFWNLPLKEEYFENLSPDPIEAEAKVTQNVLPIIIAMIIAGAVLFLAFIEADIIKTLFFGSSHQR